MLAPGEKIGPYTIRERAGAGGMATVYKAWHEGLHRHEALKVPRGAGEGGADSAYVLRLLTEARVAARLHHPNIVAIHNVSDPLASVPFFAMDWIDGQDLSQILKIKKQFSLSRTIEILHPVALALDYAHSQGVVHRDIKPANILLENKGGTWVPHVVDFGISRAAEDEEGATKLTKSGMMVGTPEYMSPEQVGSGEIVDYRTDIYSLGIVAYEMLCGTPPFTAGEGVSRLSILVAHVSHQAPLFQVCPEFPQQIGGVLLRALAKTPQSRPQSCVEFINGLQAVASEISEDDLLPLLAAGQSGKTPFDNSRFNLDNDATIIGRLPVEIASVPSPLAELTATSRQSNTRQEPIASPNSAAPPQPAERATVTNQPAVATQTNPAEIRAETLQTLRARLSAAREIPLGTPVINTSQEKAKESPFAQIIPSEKPSPIASSEKNIIRSGKRNAPSRTTIFASAAALFLVLGTAISFSMQRWQRPATASSTGETPKPSAQVSITRAAATEVEKQPQNARPAFRTIRVSRMREIPFETQTRRTSRRWAGQREVVQTGRAGAREVVLALTMQGDRELSRRKVSQRDVLQPIGEIIELGTRQPQSKPAPRRASIKRTRVTSNERDVVKVRPRREVRRVAQAKRITRPKQNVPKRRYVGEAPLPP